MAFPPDGHFLKRNANIAVRQSYEQISTSNVPTSELQCLSSTSNSRLVRQRECCRGD